MPEPAPTQPAAIEPDQFFVGRSADKLPDRGPRYQETPPDPFAAGAPFPAEPWNAVTAALFVAIALFWAARLWGRFARYPFIACCLPVLLAGGVGGTLYHATRTSRLFFLMDVIPISLLGLGGAIYLTVRLGRALSPARVLGVAAALVGAYMAVNLFVFRAFPFPNPNLPVNLSYASLAVVILAPVLATLVVTRFRHGWWVVSAVVTFGIAWFCRLVDNTALSPLPMGTHWLWHVYGAATTLLVTEYFYRIAGEPVGSHWPRGRPDIA